MKKKLLSILLFGLTLGATSCAQTPVPPQEEKPQEEAKPVLTEREFNHFRNSSLRVTGDVTTLFINQVDASKIPIPSKTTSLITKTAYTFDEAYEDKSKNISEKYFKDTDGFAVAKTHIANNTVAKRNLYYKNTDTKVVFDDLYGNPFSTIEFTDLAIDKVTGNFQITDKVKAGKFMKPITFHGERFHSLTMNYDGNVIHASYVGRSAKYSVEAIYKIEVTNEEVKDVVPYPHKAIHDDINKALKEMTAAKSYTYSWTRTNIDKPSDTMSLESKITEDAVLYPVDPFTAATKPYGTAKFSDGKIHFFEVEADGTITKKQEFIEEHTKPVFEVIAPEFFIETEVPNHYRLDNYTFSVVMASSLCETIDDKSLIMNFGLQSNLVIEVVDGQLKSFSYLALRVYENGMKTEENVCKIKDVNSTTIPYQFN